jgi:hypothetical protein
MSKTTNKFSPEVRSRAVWLVLEHEHEHPSRWATILSVAQSDRDEGHPGKSILLQGWDSEPNSPERAMKFLAISLARS